MDSNVQSQYVKDQNKQAKIMDTSGTIHWEFMLTWKEAFRNYFPRYDNNSSGTTSFFLNNVPWMVPILDMELEGETYKWINNVVLFKPAFNWCPGFPGAGYPGNAEQVSDKINRLKRGSIQYIYIIQNTDPNDIFDMVNKLDIHVQLVGYKGLVELAKTKSELS